MERDLILAAIFLQITIEGGTSGRNALGFHTVPKKWSGDEADVTTRPLSTAGGSHVGSGGISET